MRFDVKTPSQIEAERRERQNVLPVGVYDISIRTAQEKTSRAGNAMLEVIVVVYHERGEKIIIDYLVSNQQDKLYAFAAALGLEDRYQAGEMHVEDIEGCTGKAKIGIEAGKPDGKGGTYPDKNRIAFYVDPARDKPKATQLSLAPAGPPRTAAAAAAPAYQSPRDEDDDIPF